MWLRGIAEVYELTKHDPCMKDIDSQTALSPAQYACELGEPIPSAEVWA